MDEAALEGCYEVGELPTVARGLCYESTQVELEAILEDLVWIDVVCHWPEFCMLGVFI